MSKSIPNSSLQTARTLQRGSAIIWIMGLSASGKTSIANATSKLLELDGHKTYLLDGDRLRQGICKDLGYSPIDRTENLRRATEIAKLMQQEGYTVICSFITPLETDRQMIRDIIGDSLITVGLNCPLAICESRDPKGLYQKARDGEISQFTGLDAPFDPFTDVNILLDSATSTIDVASQHLVDQYRLK